MEVLILGIGAILTGEFSSPRIEGDAVLIRDGLIAAAQSNRKYLCFAT
jgi:hypothetical protein